MQPWVIKVKVQSVCYRQSDLSQFAEVEVVSVGLGGWGVAL